MKKISCACSLALSLTVANILPLRPAHAAETQLEYPELVVSPRASERLEMEAKDEPRRKWTTHIPVQVSALATLTAGLFQLSYVNERKDPSNYSSLIGISVGSAWLVGSFFLAQGYAPYQKAHERISALSKKAPRERLVAERLAEEEIDAAARMGRKIAYASILTNLGASLYMAVKSESGGVAATSAALSLLPLIFRYHWGDVARYQRDYKKKIYGPIARAALLADPVNRNLVPGFTLALQF